MQQRCRNVPKVNTFCKRVPRSGQVCERVPQQFRKCHTTWVHTHPDDVRHAGDDMPSAPPPGEDRTPSFPPSRTDDMPTAPPVGEMNKIKRRLSTYRSNMWQYRRAYRKAKREYERSGDAFFLKRMMRYRRMYRLNKQAYRALKRKHPTL